MEKVMKQTHIYCGTLIHQGFIRKSSDHDTYKLNTEWRRFFADGTPPPTEEVAYSPFAFIKIFRRGEHCEIPDECGYLMVISHQMDGNGDWLTADVKAVQSIRELKEALRQMVASSGGVVIKASPWFEHMASSLGLRQLNSEWGRL